MRQPIVPVMLIAALAAPCAGQAPDTASFTASDIAISLVLHGGGALPLRADADRVLDALAARGERPAVQVPPLDPTLAAALGLPSHGRQ